MLHAFDNDRVMMMQSVRGNRAGRMAGFSLIEVLAALVIFSIGLLGLAGLQFNALRGNQGAYESTVASLQAMDVADRLRANPVGVNAGAYDQLAVNAADPGCMASGCNAVNAGFLPAGQGVICLDSTPFDGVSQAANGCDGALTDLNGDGAGDARVFAIKIWWDDDRNPNTAMRRHILSVFP